MNDALLFLGLLFVLHRASPGRLELGGWRVKLKPGVKVRGVKPEILLAIEAIAEIYGAHPELGEFVVTSLLDGVHTPGSLHYAGEAVDIRTRDLTTQNQVKLHDLVVEALGSDYDVILESDHLHVEFDPKATVG